MDKDEIIKLYFGNYALEDLRMLVGMKPKYQKEHIEKMIFVLNLKFEKFGNYSPIWDLSDNLLKEIELKYDIPIPEVYKSIDRTGCFGCPYGRNIKKELNLISEAQRNFVCEYFKESYKIKGI